jgi:hypothetical protein
VVVVVEAEGEGTIFSCGGNEFYVRPYYTTSKLLAKIISNTKIFCPLSGTIVCLDAICTINEKHKSKARHRIHRFVRPALTQRQRQIWMRYQRATQNRGLVTPGGCARLSKI